MPAWLRLTGRSRAGERSRGWCIHSLHDDEGVLDLGEGVAYLSVQRDDGYTRAVALGATLAAHQPQEDVRVMLDPAGHPFCLYTG